jgi:hypothetical protein
MNQVFYTFLLAWWQFPWLRWLIVLGVLALLLIIIL